MFDDTVGPGAHLSLGMRRMVLTAYRRWLGFLDRDALAKPPAHRITRERVRAYVDQLSAEMRPVSIAICLEGLFYVARFSDPARNWSWLLSIARRLRAGVTPQDRFHLLVPGWDTLDYGIRLMDAALALPATGRRNREVQYRDGLLLAMLSQWPIRRRSIAALTIGGHLEFDEGGVNILLHPQDTKSQRAESCRLHEDLLPYLKIYLKDIRPRFPGSDHHACQKACKNDRT